MTVKEIATFTGKTERAIRNWVNKATEKSSMIKEKVSMKKKGDNREIDYSISEIECILNSGTLGKNAVSIVMENARRGNLPAQIMQESILTPKDMQMIGVIVGQIMKTMESRVSNIEQRFKERKALLPPPEMEPKQQLKKIVNAYCGRTGCGFQEAYSDLYREFNYIYHVNVQLSAKNRNIRSIDYINNDLNMINELISIASKIFADDQL